MTRKRKNSNKSSRVFFFSSSSSSFSSFTPNFIHYTKKYSSKKVTKSMSNIVNIKIREDFSFIFVSSLHLFLITHYTPYPRPRHPRPTIASFQNISNQIIPSMFFVCFPFGLINFQNRFLSYGHGSLIFQSNMYLCLPLFSFNMLVNT